MICAPTSRSSLGETALTVPWVPTGMKIGVSMTPWRVARRPRRALDSGSVWSRVNMKGRGEYPALSAAQCRRLLAMRFFLVDQGQEDFFQRAGFMCLGA